MLLSVKRGFQIPQRFRPAVSRMLSNTLGHVDLQRPAGGLTSIAYWMQFSRWCWTHPVPSPVNGRKVEDREGPLKSGDILFFDEFSCPLDEYRAFDEFVHSYYLKYEVLGAVQGYTRVGIKILRAAWARRNHCTNENGGIFNSSHSLSFSELPIPFKQVLLRYFGNQGD